MLIVVWNSCCFVYYRDQWIRQVSCGEPGLDKDTSTSWRKVSGHLCYCNRLNEILDTGTQNLTLESVW